MTVLILPSALTYEIVSLPDTVVQGVSQYMTRMNEHYSKLA
ncbi:MAG: hypothetical protein ACRDT0_13040 [Pseudonocardiaceae bacterium]